MNNMKTIPFDLELAKEIHAGKREGRIVTRLGSPVEILTFEASLNCRDIVFLTKANRGRNIKELHAAYSNGSIYIAVETDYDLFLEVPAVTPAEEPEFKPFDRVLVRDSEDSTWLCNIFSRQRPKGCDYPYECITGNGWRECIPYEGNEELLGTTNGPKQ